MISKFLLADRNYMAAAMITMLGSGAGACTIEIYDGAIIAGPATAITTQIKLGTGTCSDPIGEADGGAVVFDPIAEDPEADASGMATWGLLRDGDGVARWVFDVTDGAGTGVCKLNTTTIVADGPIQFVSCVIAMGGA